MHGHGCSVPTSRYRSTKFSTYELLNLVRRTRRGLLRFPGIRALNLVRCRDLNLAKFRSRSLQRRTKFSAAGLAASLGRPMSLGRVAMMVNHQAVNHQAELAAVGLLLLQLPRQRGQSCSLHRARKR
eukprot:SAG31_NODE_1121_length_9797_cov_16.183749_12_plen_127_part_00